MKIQTKVECKNCNSICNPVLIDISGVNIQDEILDNDGQSIIIISDKQRECANCQIKWNSIELHKNKSGDIEMGFGIE